MAGVSGVKARITKKGIDYVNSLVHGILADKLRTMIIPDLHGDGHHFEWHVTGIENRECSLPHSSMAFVPDQNGLNWTISGLVLKLKADWKAKYRKGWVKVSDGGHVSVELTGGNIQVIIKIGCDVNGRPTVLLASCNVDIHDVDVKFHGGTAWLYNLFSDVCGKKIGQALKDQVHKAMDKFVNVDGERAMSKLKISVPFAKSFTLDYRLTQVPVIGINYLETEHKGKVYWTGDDTEAPISPKPIGPVEDDTKMLYLWLSDYTANTMLFVGQKNDYFKYNLTAEKLPESHRYFLSTSSNQMCIGKLIPQIGKTYPNSQVEAKIVCASAPVLKVTKETVTLDTICSANLTAHTSDHKAPFLLNLSLNIGLSLKAAIVNEKVTSKIVDHSFTVQVVKSAVGAVNEAMLNPLLGMVMTFFVIPQLQVILDKGVDLPVSDDMRFENLDLHFLDGSVVIATDVLMV